MTRKILGTLITVAVLLALVPPAWARDSYQARQARQRAAIYQGMINGSISEEEFLDLDAEQYGIESLRREAMIDGYLSYDERNQLEWELELAGRNIRLACAGGGSGRWRWDPYYDRYGYFDFWISFFSRGPYWSHHGRHRGRGHYRPREYRPRPSRPRYRPPRNRPEHRRPPQIVPYGRFHIGYNGDRFGLGWSINLR